MKTRKNFVSNSSSSSFLIGFKNGKPKSKKELKKILFPKLKGTEKLEAKYGRKGSVATLNNVIDSLFNILKNDADILSSEEEIIEFISSTEQADEIAWKKKKVKELTKIQEKSYNDSNVSDEEYNKVNNQIHEFYKWAASKIWSQIKRRFVGHQILALRISDSGEGAGQVGDVLSTNEKVFKNVPHFRSSY